LADDGGIGRLRKRLAAIPAQVKAATQPALLKQAEAMATTMRALAPEDSGDLKDSITVTPAGQSTPAYSQPGGSLVVPENAVAVTVGDADVRYPHLIEHGTTKMHAQPYFWPSVRLHRKKAQAAIKRAIGKAVRENWGKS
jgi:HK97 gp10 family phage protein